MADVFISYHRKSSEALMRRIRAELEAAGFTCWNDNRNLEGGSYPGAITRAIKDCGVFLLILNKDSNVSDHVLNEVSIAFRRYKKHEPIVILPFRVDDAPLSDDMEYFISRFEMAGTGCPPQERDFQDLVKRVAYLLGGGPRPALMRPKPIIITDANLAMPPREGRWILRQTLSAGGFHTLGIRPNGSVIATGKNVDGNGQCNVHNWWDIVSISGGAYHTLGLRRDSTVAAVGWNFKGECNVMSWHDVVAVAAGYSFSVGLRKNGTLFAAGKKIWCPVDKWHGITAVAAGSFHTVGLRQNGTVIAEGDNKQGQCNVNDWRDIVAIECGDLYTIGIRRDGTVVMTGEYGVYGKKRPPDVSGWREIVAVAGDSFNTEGLRRDGTVVVVGDRQRYSGVRNWRDIVAISAGGVHTVGLRKDGTVLVAGRNNYGQGNVTGWRLRLPEWVPWPED